MLLTAKKISKFAKVGKKVKDLAKLKRLKNLAKLKKVKQNIAKLKKVKQNIGKLKKVKKNMVKLKKVKKIANLTKVKNRVSKMKKVKNRVSKMKNVKNSMAKVKKLKGMKKRFGVFRKSKGLKLISKTSKLKKGLHDLNGKRRNIFTAFASNNMTPLLSKSAKTSKYKKLKNLFARKKGKVSNALAKLSNNRKAAKLSHLQEAAKSIVGIKKPSRFSKFARKVKGVRKGIEDLKGFMDEHADIIDKLKPKKVDMFDAFYDDGRDQYTGHSGDYQQSKTVVQKIATQKQPYDHVYGSDIYWQKSYDDTEKTQSLRKLKSKILDKNIIADQKLTTSKKTDQDEKIEDDEGFADDFDEENVAYSEEENIQSKTDELLPSKHEDDHESDFIDDDEETNTTVKNLKAVFGFVYTKAKAALGGDDDRFYPEASDTALVEHLKLLRKYKNMDLQVATEFAANQIARVHNGIFLADPSKWNILNYYYKKIAIDPSIVRAEHAYTIEEIHSSFNVPKISIKIQDHEKDKTFEDLTMENTCLRPHTKETSKNFYNLEKRIANEVNDTPIFFINNPIANNKITMNIDTFDQKYFSDHQNIYINAIFYFKARYLSNVKSSLPSHSYYKHKDESNCTKNNYFRYGKTQKLDVTARDAIRAYHECGKRTLKIACDKKVTYIYCFNPLCHCTNHRSKVLSLECFTKLLAIVLFQKNKKTKALQMRYKLVYILYKLPSFATFLFLVHRKLDYFQKFYDAPERFAAKDDITTEETTPVTLEFALNYFDDLERFIYVVQNIHFNQDKYKKVGGIDDSIYFDAINDKDLTSQQSVVFIRSTQVICTLFSSISLANFTKDIDFKLSYLRKVRFDTIALENYLHVDTMLHNIFELVPLLGRFDDYELLIEPDLSLKLIKHYKDRIALPIAKGFVQELMRNKIFLKYYVEYCINKDITFRISACGYTQTDISDWLKLNTHIKDMLFMYNYYNCDKEVYV